MKKEKINNERERKQRADELMFRLDKLDAELSILEAKIKVVYSLSNDINNHIQDIKEDLVGPINKFNEDFKARHDSNR